MKALKIHLKNWQKHEDLVLNFNSNLNVITGKSDSGKSCIRRAFAWILFNDNLSEQSYRKEGTKETSVKLWLDNDFQIERIRSNTLNRYILSKEGCKDEIFDSFRKEIPEEIRDVIGLFKIEIDKDSLILNIAPQLTLPFLLDKPASFRSKLFNKLTGNELLDKMFKEFNRESLRINREIKENEELIKKQEDELADYSLRYKSLKNKLSSIKETYIKLKEEIEIYENLKDLASKLKTNKENLDFVEFKKSQIKIISDAKLKELKEQAEQLKKLQTLSLELEAIDEGLKKIEKQKEKIKIISIDWNKLKEKCETLQNLKQLKEEIASIKNKEEKVTIQKEELKKLLGNLEKELDEIWKNEKICPLCKSEIKK